VAYQHLEPFSRQITVVVGLTVVGLMALGLALSFYRNVLFETTLSDISGKNAELQQEIANGRARLEYFQSRQFKDKFAKEKLGLLNPNEKVIILARHAPDTLAVTDPEATAAAEEAAYLELLRQMPVVEHWRLYLLYPDRAQELRESFRAK